MHGYSFMPSHQDQIDKYNRVPEPGSPARTEGWALLEAAKRLASAIMHGPDGNKDTKELRKRALRLNWRLWTIFQAELTLDECTVPEEIRLNMLTLCKFIDKHTIGCLASPTADSMRVLIDINRNIAAGLLRISQEDEGQQRAANDPRPEPAEVGQKTKRGVKVETKA